MATPCIAFGASPLEEGQHLPPGKAGSTVRSVEMRSLAVRFLAWALP